MGYTIAFFGTKPYDESSFNDRNKEFGFEIRYYKGNLNKNNVLLTQTMLPMQKSSVLWQPME